MEFKLCYPWQNHKCDPFHQNLQSFLELVFWVLLLLDFDLFLRGIACRKLHIWSNLSSVLSVSGSWSSWFSSAESAVADVSFFGVTGDSLKRSTSMFLTLLSERSWKGNWCTNIGSSLFFVFSWINPAFLLCAATFCCCFTSPWSPPMQVMLSTISLSPSGLSVSLGLIIEFCLELFLLHLGCFAAIMIMQCGHL